jgi:hypothetical protein
MMTCYNTKANGKPPGDMSVLVCCIGLVHLVCCQFQGCFAVKMYMVRLLVFLPMLDEVAQVCSQLTGICRNCDRGIKQSSRRAVHCHGNCSTVAVHCQVVAAERLSLLAAVAAHCKVYIY